MCKISIMHKTIDTCNYLSPAIAISTTNSFNSFYFAASHQIFNGIFFWIWYSVSILEVKTRCKTHTLCQNILMVKLVVNLIHECTTFWLYCSNEMIPHHILRHCVYERETLSAFVLLSWLPLKWFIFIFYYCSLRK